LERGLNVVTYVLRPVAKNESLFWKYLRLRGAREPTMPRWTVMNKALESKGEVGASVAEAERIGLFRFLMDVEKTWDNLSALSYLLRTTDKTSKVFDAGSSLYSVILPWLSLYGYRRLVGMNLSFPGDILHGPIAYLKGDITKTNMRGGQFDAITSLSVLEHVNSLSAYLREMSRLLKVGGSLIISTDYWPVNPTKQKKRAYYVAITIFDQPGIRNLIQTARLNGLEITGEPDLRVKAPVVKWQGLHFTFIVLAFRKVAQA
jgi:SAM-dependent methyltransferase